MAKIVQTYIATAKIFCLVLLLITMCACSQQKTSPPANLLTKEKMIEILPDVHLAEASIQTMNSRDRDSIGRVYFTHIFRIHEVDEAAFYNSMEYYTHEPTALEEIYIKVEEKLKSMATEKEMGKKK